VVLEGQEEWEVQDWVVLGLVEALEALDVWEAWVVWEVWVAWEVLEGVARPTAGQLQQPLATLPLATLPLATHRLATVRLVEHLPLLLLLLGFLALHLCLCRLEWAFLQLCLLRQLEHQRVLCRRTTTMPPHHITLACTCINMHTRPRCTCTSLSLSLSLSLKPLLILKPLLNLKPLLILKPFLSLKPLLSLKPFTQHKASKHPILHLISTHTHTHTL